MPYDTYTIEELRCDSNKGMTLIPAFDVVVSRNKTVIDLGTLTDEYEPEITIHTTAADKATGEKSIVAGKSVTIVDTVTLDGLKKGTNDCLALPNGRPCENRIIEKEFSLLKQKAGLPNVVFHSLRHSSTTYKLKLNHGDLKVTQGDTGHAEIDMITKVYAHILDEDRKINAQKFESAFYANPDLRKVTPPQEQPQAQTIDLAALIEQLQKSPELANTLAALIAGQKAV